MPSKFDALAFLAGYFDTIEVNSTFYRPQPARTYASWAQARVAANAQFRFTVKLWQHFTHERAAPWTADDVRLVTDGLEMLQDAGRLGALLAQFPWSFKPGAAARCRARPAGGDVPRLAAWWWRCGTANGAGPSTWAGSCGTSASASRTSISRSSASRWSRAADGHERRRLRALPRPQLRALVRREQEDAAQRYDYLYSAEELAPWVERIRAAGRRRRA